VLSFHFLVRRLGIGGRSFPYLSFCFDLVAVCLSLGQCLLLNVTVDALSAPVCSSVLSNEHHFNIAGKVVSV
jgi:hypothetical protein